jgi:ATP-dependent Clp protease protease subunit
MTKNKKRHNQQFTVPLEELDPEVQKKLMDFFDTNKVEEDEEFEPMISPFNFMGGQNSLEKQGILFLNDGISKASLAPLTTKLLEYHYDLKFNDEIQLYINSPGGYLDATWAFIDLMQSIRLPIRTIAVGEIASGATMIFIAGDTRDMSPNCSAMIHHLSAGSAGSYPDLVASRKWQDFETEKIIKHFIKFSKFKTRKAVLENLLINQDNYLEPAEMKKYGLCDNILVPRKQKLKGK